MKKFQVMKEFDLTVNQIKRWLEGNPLPKSSDRHIEGSWEDFHPKYKTHYSTLMEFLKLKPETLKIILNDNNALGLLGEVVGSLILRQDFTFEEPFFMHRSHPGVLSGIFDIEKALPKQNSEFFTLGNEFTIDFKAHRIRCLEHGKYRTPEISLTQRRLINSLLISDKKVLILSLAFCKCGRIFCKYLLLIRILGK